MADYVITADSLPDYDEYGWDDYWNAHDWLTWYYAMEAKYGAAAAQNKWIQYWLDGVTFWDTRVPLDARAFNTEFKNFLHAPGHEALNAAVYDGVAGTVGAVIGGVTTTAETVGNAAVTSAKNVSDSITSITKALTYIVPAILIGGTIYLAVNFKKLST